MAYWWAAQKPVGTVVTVPQRGFTAMDCISRYQHIFKTHQMDDVILFDGSPGVDWLRDLAGQVQAKVWVVRNDAK